MICLMLLLCPHQQDAPIYKLKSSISFLWYSLEQYFLGKRKRSLIHAQLRDLFYFSKWSCLVNSNLHPLLLLVHPHLLLLTCNSSLLLLTYAVHINIPRPLNLLSARNANFQIFGIISLTYFCLCPYLIFSMTLTLSLPFKLQPASFHLTLRISLVLLYFYSTDYLYNTK